MKAYIFKFLSLVLVFFLSLQPGFVCADDYEAYQRAQAATNNAVSKIGMAEGAVGQVLSEALSGKYGEYHKWSLIDEKMTDMDKAIESSLSEISSNASALLKIDPNYRLPSITLGHPFEGNLNMARNKKTELLEMAKAESAKLEKLNDMLTKVNKALYNATKGAVGETIEGFLPSEVQLGGEAAVIVLGAYFGPPGMLVAGLGVFATFTFNSVVNLYYTSTALADQVKALTPMQEMIAANKRTVEQNIAALNQAAQEMNQIEQVLEKHQKTLDSFRGRITAAEQSWSSQSQSAYQNHQAATVAQAQALASAPKKPISIHGYAYGMPNPIPPIQPGEYSGEIDSIVTQMESYSKAVEDGGDPDNFFELVSKWEKKWSDKYKPVREDYDKKYQAYNAASEICWQKRHQAWQNFVASYEALRNSYIGKPWDDAARRAADSISAAYNTADQAALAALAPSGQALAGPVREMARLNHIRYGVDGPFTGFSQRVRNAVNYRGNEFWKKLAVWSRQLEDARVKTGQALSRIPYSSQGYKERANNLDAEISRALDWGGDVMGIRAELLSTADQLKTIGRDVKEGVKAYEQAMLEVRRVSNVGQAELGTFITSYGKLIGHPRVGGYYLGSSEEFVPNTTETSERVKGLLEYVRNNLKYEDPAYLEEAKKMDWDGLARIFEAKANEFNAYMDWAEQYINRQTVAANRLNKISREITGQPFYSTREKDFLNKEFSGPEWASIAGEIEKYATEADYKKLPWAGFQPWAGLNPSQKLNAALAVLLNRINNEMKPYVQSKANGGFIPVPENIIKPIEENWKGLRALCEKWEAQAKPLKDKMGNAPEETEKEILAVTEVWNKMPELSRKTVASDYTRFLNAGQWFRGYLIEKTNLMKTSLLPPDNGTAVQIEKLIGNYRSDLEKYQQRERQAQEEYEKHQREYEEEQAKLKAAEEDQRKKEQEKSTASIAAVSGMYDKFKQAYESRNDSQLISFMGDDWEAGDGTTLSDLQDNIRRSFKTFDEIKYNIQNLKIELRGDGKYMASYDVTITSRIYKRNLKHEEKSSVNEEVVIDGSGKPRITRTMNGRFWYVE